MAACGGRSAPQSRFLADAGYIHARPQGALVAPERRVLREATTEAFRSGQHGRVPRPVAHHDAQRHLSPRLALHVSSLRRGASRGRARGGGCRGRIRPRGARHGEAILKVVVSDGSGPARCFVPIMWSDATASMARVGDLVGPATDPHSGPAGSQGDAGRDPPSPSRRRVCAHPRPGDLAARNLVGTRCRTANRAIGWRPMTAATWQQTARASWEWVELAEYFDAPRPLPCGRFRRGPA